VRSRRGRNRPVAPLVDGPTEHRSGHMNQVFYIIGVVVVVIAVLSLAGIV
jgi:hypothetical protein